MGNRIEVSIIGAMSVCGRIGNGFKGGPADRAFLEQRRAATDASIIGASSLRQADVQFRGPGGRILGERVRAIITASGDIPVKDRSIFSSGPPPVIFTSAMSAPELESRLSGRATVVPIGETSSSSARAILDLSQAIDWLHRHRGVESVLIEGGSFLNYQALRQKVAHYILVTICPKAIGRTGTGSLLEGPDDLGLDLELKYLRRDEEEGELFLGYRVLYPR